MSRAEAAGGLDRLPWLSDEPARPTSRRSGLLGWAVVITGIVAAGLWVGMRSVEPERPLQLAVRHSATTTVRLPEAHVAPSPDVRIAPQPQVRIAPPPQVRSAPVRELRVTPPLAIHHNPAAAAAKSPRPVVAPVRTSRVAPARVRWASHATTLRPWPPNVIAGAAGRLVQVGAFGSSHQAKTGWRAMVRAYPAMVHLRALVVRTRNSKGRPFYRFQVGTTSQAHSEVLCQRVLTIHLSCAVVGLPWKAMVER